jgi:RNA polymerase primary sigma factor
MNPTEKRTRHGALLSRADEVRLARRIERGDTHAKQTMIESNLGLVRAIAGRYRDSGVPFADLAQEGTIGLMRAVERFDHRFGVKFSTYAAWWIRRSIRDAIADSKAIRVPPRANRQLAAVRRAEAELERQSPRGASDAEIADLTQLRESTVYSLRTAARVTASLDQPVGDDSTALAELISDPQAVDPLQRAIEHEQRDSVSTMLRMLPPQHGEVLAGRYGLAGNSVQSHQQIGRRLGVGEERSRQIEHESLHRLRSIPTTLATAGWMSATSDRTQDDVRQFQSDRAFDHVAELHGATGITNEIKVVEAL